MRRYNIITRALQYIRLAWAKPECSSGDVILDSFKPLYAFTVVRMSSVIWGWQQYFTELAQFLIHANMRNLGLADEDGSANIVERLQVHHVSRSRSFPSQCLPLSNEDLYSKSDCYQAACGSHY